MEILLLSTIYFLAVVAPAVIWLWFFIWLDRKEPEPKKLLWSIFRLGFLAMAIAAALEFFLEKIFAWGDVHGHYALMPFKISLGSLDTSASLLLLLSFFLAGPIEELVKYLVLKKTLYLKKDFNQIADGIVYGVVLALGFSFVENTGYFLDIYWNFSGEDFLFLIALRGFSTTLIHITATGILGLYLGRAKFNPAHSKGLILRGIILASLIHGIYNLAIFFSFGLAMNAAMAILAMIFLILEFQKEEFQKIQFKAPSKEKTSAVESPAAHPEDYPLENNLL